MLNPKQEKFCLEYIRTANATTAYQTAFEIKNKTSAKTAGSRLLADERIQNRLKELNAGQETKSIADSMELKKRLTSIIRGETTTQILQDGEFVNAPVSMKDRLKAMELLSRISGLFVNKAEFEITSAVPVVIKDDI